MAGSARSRPRDQPVQQGRGVGERPGQVHEPVGALAEQADGPRAHLVHRLGGGVGTEGAVQDFRRNDLAIHDMPGIAAVDLFQHGVRTQVVAQQLTLPTDTDTDTDAARDQRPAQRTAAEHPVHCAGDDVRTRRFDQAGEVAGCDIARGEGQQQVLRGMAGTVRVQESMHAARRLIRVQKLADRPGEAAAEVDRGSPARMVLAQLLGQAAREQHPDIAGRPAEPRPRILGGGADSQRQSQRRRPRVIKNLLGTQGSGTHRLERERPQTCDGGTQVGIGRSLLDQHPEIRLKPKRTRRHMLGLLHQPPRKHPPHRRRTAPRDVRDDRRRQRQRGSRNSLGELVGSESGEGGRDVGRARRTQQPQQGSRARDRVQGGFAESRAVRRPGRRRRCSRCGR